ncbi:Serine/threonine-protein kinase pakC [Diplonema papillatum]|nr:Serine/threonine-protein kinase pakC [Diplonema papillatum]
MVCLKEEGQCIGEGGFGKVYACVLEDGVRAAVKRGAAKQLENELETLRSVQGCRQIVGLIGREGIRDSSGGLCIVLELMECDLARVLASSDGRKITEQQTAWVGNQVAHALAYLHTLDVTHGDVKPANILLSDDGRSVKLTDFGSSNNRSEVPQSMSQGYRTPESVIGAKSSTNSWEVDVWCLGVALLECLQGANPFDAPALSSLYEMCLLATPPFPASFPGVDPETSRTFHELSVAERSKPALPNSFFTAALHLTPCMRPSPVQLLADPFLQDAACAAVALPARPAPSGGGCQATRHPFPDATPPRRQFGALSFSPNASDSPASEYASPISLGTPLRASPAQLAPASPLPLLHQFPLLALSPDRPAPFVPMFDRRC